MNDKNPGGQRVDDHHKRSDTLQRNRSGNQTIKWSGNNGDKYIVINPILTYPAGPAAFNDKDKRA